MPPSTYESDQKPQSKGFFSSLLEPDDIKMNRSRFNLMSSHSKQANEKGPRGCLKHLMRPLFMSLI